MRRRTDHIVIHCSATRPSSDIGIDEIREWHTRPKDEGGRGWRDVGYHAVIRRNGEIEFGRHFDEPGAHVLGWNTRTVGVCLIGGIHETTGDPEQNFNNEQYVALNAIVTMLRFAYPGATVVGHRDLSPDQDGDGIIEDWEWVKSCPCFEVSEVIT